jgi:hypothetical protein
MYPESRRLPEYKAGFGNYSSVDFTNGGHLCTIQGNEKDVGPVEKVAAAGRGVC